MFGRRTLIKLKRRAGLGRKVLIKLKGRAGLGRKALIKLKVGAGRTAGNRAEFSDCIGIVCCVVKGVSARLMCNLCVDRAKEVG